MKKILMVGGYGENPRPTTEVGTILARYYKGVSTSSFYFLLEVTNEKDNALECSGGGIKNNQSTVSTDIMCQLYKT